MDKNPYILVCTCACTDLLPDGKADEIMRALGEKGLFFRAVSDLCGLAVEDSDKLAELKKAEDLIVIACYPRAVKWILKMAGIDRLEGKTAYFNMRTDNSEAVLSGIIKSAGAKDVADCSEVEKWGGSWRPWYPVIDYDRCTNCGQCVDFCLFGVYEIKKEGKVVVTEPSNCKDQCPACARICPSAAIIFPKFTGSPVNGEEITDEEGVGAAIKVNMDEVLGNNIYKALAERRIMAKKRRLLKKKDGMKD